MRDKYFSLKAEENEDGLSLQIEGQGFSDIEVLGILDMTRDSLIKRSKNRKHIFDVNASAEDFNPKEAIKKITEKAKKTQEDK